MQLKYMAAVFITAAIGLSGCDNGTGFNITPRLSTDTILIAAPLAQNAAIPTALDITTDGFGGIVGGVFPEEPGNALAWDFVVRIVGNELALVPPGAIGVPESNAAITPPIDGETFESLRETPGQSTFVSDSAIAMVTGRVYAARSRPIGNGCTVFSKLAPLEVDVAGGRLRIQITTNGVCSDARLVPVD